MTTHDARAIWAAQLADMPEEAILSYLRERGHGDVAHVLEMRGRGNEVEIAINRCVPVDTVRERAVRLAQLLNQGRSSSLPPGYPPYADEDEIPFNALEDTRS